MNRYQRRLLLVMGLLLLFGGCAEPPQLGGSAESLKATDALWTALSARDLKLLDQCEKDLVALKESGKLLEPAFEHLQGVINDGRAGDWDGARKDLKKFIKVQRRTP